MSTFSALMLAAVLFAFIGVFFAMNFAQFALDKNFGKARLALLMTLVFFSASHLLSIAAGAQ